MFGNQEFYGSATVGDRGQIVLPAVLRKKYKINARDKLLVMGNEHMHVVVLVKAEVLGSALEKMDKRIKEISKRIRNDKGK